MRWIKSTDTVKYKLLQNGGTQNTKVSTFSSCRLISLLSFIIGAAILLLLYYNSQVNNVADVAPNYGTAWTVPRHVAEDFARKINQKPYEQQVFVFVNLLLKICIRFCSYSTEMRSFDQIVNDESMQFDMHKRHVIVFVHMQKTAGSITTECNL
jgi:hypothetical protein